MSGIVFGLFQCVGKKHSVNRKKVETWKLIFEDDDENKLTVNVTEITYGTFRIGDPLPWKLVRYQSRIEEKILSEKEEDKT